MFASFVAWVLNNYLGKYVENLNTDQLTIALSSGEVELENLPLRKNALRYLGLPFEIHGGFIGKVKLQIPVTQIRSSPWIIHMEQLYFVAGPLSVDEWNPVLEENAIQEMKQRSLDKLEAQWRFENDQESSSYYASTYSSWLNFGTGFITNIIENLQLRIKDVHFRYEDNVSVIGRSVALGITIESLSAQSCNDNWEPQFSNWINSQISFKLLELQNFALYCTQLTCASDIMSHLNLTDLAVAMSSHKNVNHSKHYIISPVSAKAHIKRNRSEHPLRGDSPRIVCDLQLQDVPITLVDWQYDLIVKCVNGLETIAQIRAYRRLRPVCSVNEDCRAWWLYAISCYYVNLSAVSVDHDLSSLPSICRSRPTWESTGLRARQMVTYVKLYARILCTPSITITAEEKKLKEDVEWTWTLADLKILRELAMRSVPLANRQASNQTGRSNLMGWFPNWIGWYSSGTQRTDDASPVNNDADRLEGELLEAISNSVQNNTLLRRDVVFGKFIFLLRSGKLCLCSIDNDHESLPMVDLEFKDLSLEITSKPRLGAHLVSLSLGSLYLRDLFTPNTQFPVIIGPSVGQDILNLRPANSGRGSSPRVNLGGGKSDDVPLFHMEYEKRSENSTFDYRLSICTKSLDIVYQPSVVKWLTEFVCLPHHKSITHSHIEAMKTRTRNELIRNWEHILHGRMMARKCWELHLDITAPQIFFVEKFCDVNGAIAVVDFGRLHLRNNFDGDCLTTLAHTLKENDDDEMFMTPCSTPPVSEESDDSETQSAFLTSATLNDVVVNEASFHRRIYDRYKVDLTDMQILIGKVKENWRYAHNKGTSTLHVLDRFNISLQVERRIVHTNDPQYPSLTVFANLPKLVAHFNEHKISAARKLAQIMSATGLPSPFASPDSSDMNMSMTAQNGRFNNLQGRKTGDDDDTYSSFDTSVELSRLVMLQFSVDHMALEVQSRGRSVAELQVTGVRMAFTKRPVDLSIALTVHGLLLVDALQTFGPDFELLIASHKHVGMDSMSGSIRDSEPTSPTSPGSPDPHANRAAGATSPLSLTQALRNLATSPPPGSAAPTWPRNSLSKPIVLDAEALISVEILLFTGPEPVQVANIQFNNLDIIANQETIVELIGFVQRVFPEFSGKNQPKATRNFSMETENSNDPHNSINMSNEMRSKKGIAESTDSLFPEDDTCGESNCSLGTTEITFDFHRLNVLLLRGVVRDGFIFGRKICTATMTEAKIQATVDSNVIVEGSLGGLQIVDLTPEGSIHQRIVSVGRDPLQQDINNTHPLYMVSSSTISTGNSENNDPFCHDRKAFSFKVTRSLSSDSSDSAEVIVRMASLWYTYSPLFVAELQSCAKEFKQYLAHLARTIKSAATDMALGLVHARAEALAQAIYMNSRLSTSLYGSALSFSDVASPRKRRRSSSMEQSFSGYSSVQGTVPQTPYSPQDDDEFFIDIKLDIELDSPVLVLPRNSSSTQVFVAHLGKIYVNNCSLNDTMKSCEMNYGRNETYMIEVRDMNLYSLDTSTRRIPGPITSRPEVLYCCDILAKPLLHDTKLRLTINRHLPRGSSITRPDSMTNILLDNSDDLDMSYMQNDNMVKTVDLNVSGSVVTCLKVSLTRNQYEQVLDTVQFLSSVSNAIDISTNSARGKVPGPLSDITEEDIGVTTLKMDPHVRAKLFPQTITKPKLDVPNTVLNVKVSFALPTFIIELRGDSPIGEQALVDLTLREFEFIYEKSHLYETNIQISLKSLFMEDLLQPDDSKQRPMVITSALSDNKRSAVVSDCISHSCPNIAYRSNGVKSCSINLGDETHGSLPDHINSNKNHQKPYSTYDFRQNSEWVETYDEPSLPGNSEIVMENRTGCCPCTPPPSPRHKRCNETNLVLISTLVVDPLAPNFKTHYNSIQRSTSVDFNCLDLVVSVESWVLVLDFFSASPSSDSNNKLIVENVSDDKSRGLKLGNTETNITAKSLTVVLVRPDRDVAKANISNVDISVRNSPFSKEVDGQLGSMSLQDLTSHGQLYRERFLTTGKKALLFKYSRNSISDSIPFDCQLKLKMSSVRYVHTKRFVVEIQAFFNHFSQLQTVMTSIRQATSAQTLHSEISRLSLVLEAESPVILIPVSFKNSEILIVDLGQLKVNNCFKNSGDVGTISLSSDNEKGKTCLLDVMYLHLQNVNLHSGRRESDLSMLKNLQRQGSANYYEFSSCYVTKIGRSLLTEKCHLRIQVERNLNSRICHIVPDMSIHGELSTLNGTLDLSQYCLIRGLLSHNIGENTEHILASVQPTTISTEDTSTNVWTLSSLRLDLLNVKVRLQQTAELPPLACINFIKSRLVIETFSNLSQDIDLVSQEIRLRDTRFEHLKKLPANANVFHDILQPINISQSNSNLVQVEVHSRRRHDGLKFTILLNNIRLIAVLDWWQLAREFILQDIPEIPTSSSHQSDSSLSQVASDVFCGENPADASSSNNVSADSDLFELKLNITDSELVVLEDTTLRDTNAVILKSTTVITYKPHVLEKPLSCNINNCEMYSCVVGMDDETALSIIDPVTLNVEVNDHGTLELSCHALTIRLSYHDMRMFTRIIQSLPVQMRYANQEPSDVDGEVIKRREKRKQQLTKLQTLGFKRDDCAEALDICKDNLNDAALWLTQHASSIHNAISNEPSEHSGKLNINTFEIKANIISLCVIDDCGDVDVPLLEVSVSELNLRKRLHYGHSDPLSIVASDVSIPDGAFEGVLSSDYYNRVLSGWEPIIEPWRCLVTWDHALAIDLQKNRLQLNVQSDNLLNINVTATLTDLFQQVKDSWLQDLYSLSMKDNVETTSSQNPRRRLPFIPYALKNNIGIPLKFMTVVSDMDAILNHGGSRKWFHVAPGDTVPFSFKRRDKIRHSDSHKMRMHQLVVKLDGFEEITPITIDKVGIYFRHGAVSLERLSHDNRDLPPARIVFDVALDGSARKLVTVRSALVVINKLPEPVDVKFEILLPGAISATGSAPWVPTRTFSLASSAVLPVTLEHAHSSLSVKPISSTQFYTYSSPIVWSTVHNDVQHMFRACHSHRGHLYQYCAEIVRENFPHGPEPTSSNPWLQPAHTITLLPTLLLINLLPTDLHFSIGDVRGRIASGCDKPISSVNAENSFELLISIENFPNSSAVIVPDSCDTGFSCRVRMEDTKGRKIFVNTHIVTHSDARLKIIISAPFWIVNKTGLPLVFRQGGVTTETAGQFTENEVARMMAPLLFSFADPDASPTVVARVGAHVILGGNPQWCQHFHLQRGIQVRKLSVTMPDGRPDVVFVVGIEVRRGKGRYRTTNIVTISPRFRLYNKSGYQLLFAQSCYTSNLYRTPTGSPTTPTLHPIQNQGGYMKAMPDCHMAFHWPRLDRDQLLCVLIEDVPDCCWSGGLRIDGNYSQHVNIRDANGRIYFLRLEVVLQGATYLIVFADADKMPPPIRVDNYAEVTVRFAQACCRDQVHTNARAHSSVPYAWDQPTKSQLMCIEAPGGVFNNYDLNKVGEGLNLTYENFIYIALIGTFKSSRNDPLDIENQELVLDVLNGRDVVLSHKRKGQRSQLWRMSATGQLQHEGTSPPIHPNQKRSDDNLLILDIEGPAPQPNSYTRLVVRRPDPRRQSTQTWRFTDEGRLCCAHYNMCVQAQDGFFGIREGNSVVLGLPQPVCHRTTDNGVPLEQAVSKQRFRPGSGFLTVEITTDGPTKVVRIRDIDSKKQSVDSRRVSSSRFLNENEWLRISLQKRPQFSLYDETNVQVKEFQLMLKLKGLGLSLIAKKPPQELLFAQLSDIVSETTFTGNGKRFCISVKDIQIDNQLLETPIPVFLYVTRSNSRSMDNNQTHLPALDVSVEMQPVVNENAIIFNHFIVRLKKLTVHLEERLLLKLCAFFRFYGDSTTDNTTASPVSTVTSGDSSHSMDDERETVRLLTEVGAAHSKRYYFGIIQLVPDQIRLNMLTAAKLPASLQLIKKRLGLTLIKFEDAAVDLEAYIRKHPFETVPVLINSIVKHFKDELMWQAGIILGSVDFLGNPLGFVNDVTEGVSGLIYDGNVSALVKNVTHGLSNSAAKVTETLSDGLGRVTMDDEHEEMRQKIRQVSTGRGRDHLVAGFKGLGFGLLGGATGIFKQVYEGSHEGVHGVFSGLGKGLLGAVTKPVVGVLDLASETARAVRDSSRSSSRMIPIRCRLPRCVVGPGGLLPRYNSKHSRGQMYLFEVNDRKQVEQLVAYENLRSGSEDLRIVISNQKVRIVTSTNAPTLTVVIECNLSDLHKSVPISESEGDDTRHYIEITMQVAGARAAMVYVDPIKKPRVRCDTSELARTISQQINCAKRLYDERLHTLTSDNMSHLDE